MAATATTPIFTMRVGNDDRIVILGFRRKDLRAFLRQNPKIASHIDIWEEDYAKRVGQVPKDCVAILYGKWISHATTQRLEKLMGDRELFIRRFENTGGIKMFLQQAQVEEQTERKVIPNVSVAEGNHQLSLVALPTHDHEAPFHEESASATNDRPPVAVVKMGDKAALINLIGDTQGGFETLRSMTHIIAEVRAQAAELGIEMTDTAIAKCWYRERKRYFDRKQQGVPEEAAIKIAPIVQAPVEITAENTPVEKAQMVETRTTSEGKPSLFLLKDIMRRIDEAFSDARKDIIEEVNTFHQTAQLWQGPLQQELEQLREENARLREENASLKADMKQRLAKLVDSL